MGTVGLRELRHHASELVRRVEAGEVITTTVSGRPSARLVSARPTQWRTWTVIADLFHGAADPVWERDRDLLVTDVRDPWLRVDGAGHPPQRAILDTRVVIAASLTPTTVPAISALNPVVLLSLSPVRRVEAALSGENGV